MQSFSTLKWNKELSSSCWVRWDLWITWKSSRCRDSLCSSRAWQFLRKHILPLVKAHERRKSCRIYFWEISFKSLLRSAWYESWYLLDRNGIACHIMSISSTYLSLVWCPTNCKITKTLKFLIIFRKILIKNKRFILYLFGLRVCRENNTAEMSSVKFALIVASRALQFLIFCCIVLFWLIFVSLKDISESTKAVTKDERVFVLKGCKNKLLLSFNTKILSALTAASINCQMSFNKIKISEIRTIQEKI